ncbi:hypothetical protein TH61_16465 [Rufibacter sp. DG15C]|nr:hypothetical protein TH61_16465 [Rufibacter sp. DG15C]
MYRQARLYTAFLGYFLEIRAKTETARRVLFVLTLDGLAGRTGAANYWLDSMFFRKIILP